MAATDIAIADRQVDMSNHSIDDAIRGGNVMLGYWTGTDWKFIATATSNGIEMSRDEIDVANKSLGGWTGTLGGRRSWSTTVSGFLYKENDVTRDELWDLFNNDVPLDVVYSTVSNHTGGSLVGVDYSSESFFQGKANMTSLSFGGDDNTAVTFEISLTGAGPLELKQAPVS